MLTISNLRFPNYTYRFILPIESSRSRRIVCATIDAMAAVIVMNREIYRPPGFIEDAIRSKKLALFLSFVRFRSSAISNLVPLLSAYRKMYMGDQVLGYTCTMCSKFYKMWSNYLKHKCEPPQFKCPLCPFAAFKAFILHAHQAEQHFKVTSPNT